MAKPTKRPTKRRIEPVTDKVMPTGKPREAVKRVTRPDDEVRARSGSGADSDDDDLLDDELGSGKRSKTTSEGETPLAGTKARKSAKAEEAQVLSRREAKREAKRANKRVTPKGTVSASNRYTPPTARYEDMPSPLWVPILMFTFFGLGMLTIFLNYVALLPGATSNWYLLLGLGFILAGIITATQYR